MAEANRLCDSFGASAIAWTEFRSFSVSDGQLRALDQLLLAGILAYERAQADLAGELFQKTMAKGKNRLDTMIAATSNSSRCEPRDRQSNIER